MRDHPILSAPDWAVLAEQERDLLCELADDSDPYWDSFKVNARKRLANFAAMAQMEAS
jgi:hypothetical protein